MDQTTYLSICNELSKVCNANAMVWVMEGDKDHGVLHFCSADSEIGKRAIDWVLGNRYNNHIEDFNSENKSTTPALYNVQKKSSSVISILGHMIQQDDIIGISPAMQEISADTIRLRWKFELYTKNYAIQIATDWYSRLEDETVRYNFDLFRKDHNAISTTIQNGDWGIWHSYIVEKQKAANKKSSL